MIKLRRIFYSSLVLLVAVFISPSITNAQSMFFDDFNRAGSTSVQNGWVEDLGDWSIDNNELTTQILDNQIIHNLFNPNTPDYYVKVDAKSDDSYNDSPALLARYVDDNNFYLFQTAAYRAQLLKKVDGNWTLLGDVPFSRSSNTYNTYVLDVKGDQISAYIDGALILGATDNTFTAAGYAGLRRGGGLFKITFDNFEIGSPYQPAPTNTPSPTPIPTSTPTSTPTPTPSPTPTPMPVTKVALIPGMGASWNVDALMNCKSSGYSGSWTLAPYAKDIYQEVTNQLANRNWNTIPFYYDWRNDIRDNANLFASLIDSNTVNGEKVGIVGHSMGGLIGRNYLETQAGGKAAKLMMVGTPNQGSALAYPAVVNGEIWTKDLVERIAVTLLFKRCGVPASFNNLLPTYNYLRNNQTGQLKNVTTMRLQNNYLPTNFVAPFWGVKIGTLAGIGKETLKIIDVKNSTKWPDGMPVGRENVIAGDGTVLADSVQIIGAANETISQSHSGIIASTEGVNKILEFLGSPGINDPPYTDPISALIVIGYPGTFWMTDKKGTTFQSDNGMISIINPKDSDYTLQMIPTSATTNLIIGQFLPNGKTLYKEYKFRGLVQSTRTIEFRSKDPKENPIRENEDR